MADPKKEHPPHVLDDLVARAGKNNPKLLDAQLEGSSNEELIARGASIATARLVTDGVRLFGQALDFLDGASAPQKKHLRGVTAALIGVAIHHLDSLHKLEAETTEAAKGNATARVVIDEEVRTVVAGAISLRDQAFDAMRDAAGGSTKLRKQVEEAFGVADPPALLADGLKNMSDLLTEWLEAKAPALTARLALANLDKAFAAELGDAAIALRTVVAAAAKRPSAKAMQAALDREDGVQILLLGQIIRAFEGAHGRDATIPRLVPISARRLFNRNTSKKPVVEPEPKTP